MADMGPQVIIALDFDDQASVDSLVEQLQPTECRLKVGKQLFTQCGPQLVKGLVNKGFDVFLDLKFHDIPNTVAKACLAAADLGVWMVNVHASGGAKMMSHTKEAFHKQGVDQTKLIAVTVLTSMDQAQLDGVVGNTPIDEQVLRLARLTQQSGLDGVVCSAQEASMLRANLGRDFDLVTPGIRPEGSAANDQTRIVTPHQAIKLGVNYMVVGRPITQATDPLNALRKINQDIAAAKE